VTASRRTELFVGAVVMREAEVLLVRQSAGHPLAGRWTIPWGRVEPGESPMSAALRETAEEGGVEARLEGLLGVQELPAPQAGGVALVYLCTHVAGDLQPRDRETDAAAYFSTTAVAALSAQMEPWSQWLVLRVLAGGHALVRAAGDNPLQSHGAFL
jgi:ADP-ribose pyrophosphatase YjhB (NUDIX family)